MTDWDTSVLRSELLDRRTRLESARTSGLRTEGVEKLLAEVDAALERMDHGSYGVCEVCHDPIEKDRLFADPLTRVCLGDLDENEKRALQDDLNLALEIQNKLLPARFVRAQGWEAHYHYEPAGPVSGDFCDLVRSEGDRLFFAVGDVAGKGVAASLLMSNIHATFRTLLSIGAPIEEMLARANRLFCTSTLPSHYATVACGFADRTGCVEIASAGHCPPLLVRAHGVEQVDATGLPLGLFRDGQFSSTRLQLCPGDSLVLYTDGLTEARNAADNDYGLSRLVSVLPECRELEAGHISKACIESLNKFLAGARKADDLTVLVLRRAEG